MRWNPALVLLSACSSFEMPDAAELYGTWLNVDEGQVRAFMCSDSAGTDEDLAGYSDVFWFWSYTESQAPLEAQAGTYTLEERELNDADGKVRPALVQVVLRASEASQVGQTYGTEILDFDGETFVLASQTSSRGERVFTLSDALP